MDKHARVARPDKKRPERPFWFLNRRTLPPPGWWNASHPCRTKKTSASSARVVRDAKLRMLEAVRIIVESLGGRWEEPIRTPRIQQQHAHTHYLDAGRRTKPAIAPRLYK